MNSIFTRTSVRAYTNEVVSEEKIKQLLKAAMAAPSAGNQQPWEFYVVEDRDTLEALSKTSPYAGCVKGASVAIIPCYRTKKLMFPEYAQIDMSIACQNIWLEATELGLGAVWLGIAPLEDRMDAVGKVIGLPEELKAFAIISVGVPAKVKDQQDRYDETRIHRL
ncbi:nitroreductase family protein [Lachnospiraceae bacterium KM106-2]|nr:nitroreductase family protein [Lachnospiraceae bacterium KM106-2]